MKSGVSSKHRMVMTVGHSTREIGEFIALMREHGVKQVVDVRTVPRSRHNPQFNRESLPGVLRAARIGYRHMAGLGGLRHARADSRNMAWRNSSFRGYADYMQTTEFRKSLRALMELAKKRQVAIMCAEAVPWRCHRSLIGDALVAWDFAVEHIMGKGKRRRHELRSWAVVRRRRVSYPLVGAGNGGADESKRPRREIG